MTNKEIADSFTLSLTMMAMTLKEARIPFVFAIEWTGKDEEFWSAMFGDRKQREKVIASMAVISSDMAD